MLENAKVHARVVVVRAYHGGGLAELLSSVNLGTHTAHASRWCSDQGAERVVDIAEADMVEAFVTALREGGELKPIPEKRLRNKLRALVDDTSTSAP